MQRYTVKSVERIALDYMTLLQNKLLDNDCVCEKVILATNYSNGKVKVILFYFNENNVRCNITPFGNCYFTVADTVLLFNALQSYESKLNDTKESLNKS